MTDNITTPLPPHYTTNIAVDPRGFVRVDGLCTGRLITEEDRLFFEVKDHRPVWSNGRGASLLRIPLDVYIKNLTNDSE